MDLGIQIMTDEVTWQVCGIAVGSIGLQKKTMDCDVQHIDLDDDEPLQPQLSPQ